LEPSLPTDHPPASRHPNTIKENPLSKTSSIPLSARTSLPHRLLSSDSAIPFAEDGTGIVLITFGEPMAVTLLEHGFEELTTSDGLDRWLLRPTPAFCRSRPPHGADSETRIAHARLRRRLISHAAGSEAPLIHVSVPTALELGALLTRSSEGLIGAFCDWQRMVAISTDRGGELPIKCGLPTGVASDHRLPFTFTLEWNDATSLSVDDRAGATVRIGV
jgi:hypothetical protein